MPTKLRPSLRAAVSPEKIHPLNSELEAGLDYLRRATGQLEE
jgi:hypothetical protein